MTDNQKQNAEDLIQEMKNMEPSAHLPGLIDATMPWLQQLNAAQATDRQAAALFQRLDAARRAAQQRLASGGRSVTGPQFL